MPSAPAETRLAQIAAKLRTAARGQFQPFGVESHGFRRRRDYNPEEDRKSVV